MTWSRVCLLCSLCLWPALGHAQANKAVGLNDLLKAFASMPGLEARFVEEKHMQLLAKPLQSEGRIYFTHPGLLLRRVETPRASDVIITPDRLRLRDADGEQAIDLRERADLRPFVESLVWILAGDQKRLSKVFALSFEPEQAGKPWQMSLTPKGAPLDKLVKTIRIQGSGLAVREIRVQETAGDETVTRILEANPRRRFTGDERRRLFGDR